MKHLFTIGEDVWDSMDLETVRNTAAAMRNAGLLHMPYREFDIQGAITKSALKQIFSNVPEETPTKSYTFRYLSGETLDDATFFVKIGGRFVNIRELTYDLEKQGKSTDGAFESARRMAGHYVITLVVLLATKNAKKTTEKIKKHGPKSRKRPREYDYITTIKIGKITETCRSEGDGQSSVRPHLRRGHIRNQRVGKGLSEVRQVFIQPCFINADENWIKNQRKEYRIAA